MMKLNSNTFAYNATVKLNELPCLKAQSTFPGIIDVAINSRTFSSYTECLNSAKSFMNDIVKDVNAQTPQQFTVSIEVNPLHTGIDTRSRNWADGEVSRFWIFDKKQEGAVNIHAVGQARIFATDEIKPTTN
jgi:hypothetical protein